MWQTGKFFLGLILFPDHMVGKMMDILFKVLEERYKHSPYSLYLTSSISGLQTLKGV